MERLNSGKGEKGNGKWILFLTLSLFPFTVSLAAFAESPQDLFQKGNAAYAQGQFDPAVAAYESARAQGIQSGVLDYNLGNAYYKAGQVGKAIASYERAFRLNSSDGDVIYNLNLALTKVGDPLLPPGSLLRLFWRLFFSVSLNTLTLVTSLFFIFTCVECGLFFLRLGGDNLPWVGQEQPYWKRLLAPRFSAESGVGIGMAFLALILWLGLRIADAQRREALVIVPTAEVRGGPNMTYTANFTVPEGHRVLILDEQEPVQGWLEIGVPDQGLKGWIPDASVEVI